MRNGICPKCEATEVYTHEASPRSSDRVTLKEGIVGKDASAVVRYVCATCGYLEYYVPHAEDLRVVREQWTRVAGERKQS